MSPPHKPKVIFVAPYPFGRVASQRFRFEQYWEELSSSYRVDFQSFLSDKSFEQLYRKGKYIQKSIGVLLGFFRRAALLFRLYKYDFVFIHREASPIGPPIFEWLIWYVFRKKIVYDFDDAIWLRSISSSNRIASAVKCPWKVSYICKWAWKVTCGNDFLREFALKYTQRAHFLPTTLDLSLQPTSISIKPRKESFTLGWTGTHSTLKYLQILLPTLQELEKEREFQFIVIADEDPVLPLKDYLFIPWCKATEWRDLAQTDIGLMPLGNTDWEEGKCGFKALQYMSLGIPTLVSPTKANEKIVQNGINGFVCRSSEDWLKGINLLMDNREQYQAFSSNGRKTVEMHYSKKAWQSTYQALFQ